jgi:hypothetical protein
MLQSLTRPLRLFQRKPLGSRWYVAAGSEPHDGIKIRMGRQRELQNTDRLMQQLYQTYLDKSTPYITYRWIGTAVVFLSFAARIVYAQGWYIGMRPSLEPDEKEHGSLMIRSRI